jgi:hypothetical protein
MGDNFLKMSLEKSDSKIGWVLRGQNRIRGVMLMTDAETSFCKTEIMSVCTATTDAQQKDCCYYEKSCRTDKCMYYIFDEYCDCLKAQMSAN